MHIIATAEGEDLQSSLDPRFGRARLFLKIDTETGACEVFDNSVNLNAAQGAGIQSARRVVELGAEAVLTGHVGPKAFSALKQAGIPVYAVAETTVAEAVEHLKRGELQPLSAADSEGHL